MLTEAARLEIVQMRVSDGAPPIAGRVVATDTAVEFQPKFGLDRGLSYQVRVRRGPSDSTIAMTVRLPAGDRTPRTFVSALRPSGDTVPENLLRLYVEFSAPMSNTGGLEHVKLLDDRGREVKQAFLPLEADFWNRERTRYTLFLDPGRVKQGIKPNEDLGRPLHAGRRYSIVIDSAWTDAEGRPLTKSFRREFVVTHADERPLSIDSWILRPPAVNTLAPVMVKFNKPVDHGLLMRALGVERDGKALYGDAEIGAGELTWTFTPKEPWKSVEYRIVVLMILEDPQGNQIDKSFEVDMFDRVDKSAAPERKYIPFTPAKALPE